MEILLCLVCDFGQVPPPLGIKYTCINTIIKSNTSNKYLCSILIKIDNDYQQRHGSPDNINKLKLCPNQACENKMLQKNFFLLLDTKISEDFEIVITMGVDLVVLLYNHWSVVFNYVQPFTTAHLSRLA